MAVLEWDKVGERIYETGVSHGVLYPIQEGGDYSLGVVWNGLSAVNENPSGGDPSPIWADNIKYLNLQGIEEYGATIEAYTYPDEFGACDGSASLVAGVNIGQQSRKIFGFSYQTLIGNDVDGTEKGYKIHIVYGCKASPTSKNYATVNDNPEAINFSWEVTTTPVAVAGHKPTATVEIDSTKFTSEQMKKVTDVLYGTEMDQPRLPLPDEIKTLLSEG